jgi:hypothetical protein
MALEINPTCKGRIDAILSSFVKKYLCLDVSASEDESVAQLDTNASGHQFTFFDSQ